MDAPELSAPKPAELELKEGGRIVIPSAFREALDVSPGDKLLMRYENGEVRLFTRRSALRRAQQIAAQYKTPGESVVDDFLAERRALWGEE